MPVSGPPSNPDSPAEAERRRQIEAEQVALVFGQGIVSSSSPS